jgi:hypothetical protein
VMSHEDQESTHIVNFTDDSTASDMPIKAISSSLLTLRRLESESAHAMTVNLT